MSTNNVENGFSHGFDPSREIPPLEQFNYELNLVGALSAEVQRLRSETTTLKEHLNRAETDNVTLQIARDVLEVEASLNPVSLYYNQRGLERRFYEYTAANPDSEIGVFAVDIGGFKAVNDTLGHEKGDELLRRIGHLFRMTDVKGLVANPHGDEFVIVVPREHRPDNDTEENSDHSDTEISNEEFIAAVVERLKGFGALLVMEDPRLAELSFSIAAGGVIHRPGAPIDESLVLADAKMYQDKRGSLPPLTPEQEALLEQRRAIDRQLAATGLPDRQVAKYLEFGS